MSAMSSPGFLIAMNVPPSAPNRLTIPTGAAKSQIEILSLALNSYRMDNDEYPTTAQGLTALRLKPTIAPLPKNWRGPYLTRELGDDPWGLPYVYEAPGSHNPNTFDLYSLGKDGKPGGVGENVDITSWGGELTQ